MAARPRYVPDVPFPPYAYVPGRSPHPEREPRGHSYGQPRETPPIPHIDAPRESRAFLRGVDLFNFGYYWEAHEAWEGLWNACGRTGPMADLLKGLIKLAAAGVKSCEGNGAGVTRHGRRAAELWRGVAAADPGRTHWLGLSLADLQCVADELAARDEAGHSPEVGGLPITLTVEL